MNFDEWLAALERRHLANLRVPELTRALRAVSSAYVERRHTVTRGGPLDSAGKRAAFALFYAPLHFLATAHVVASLPETTTPVPSSILDIGCGTGAAGASWALAANGCPVHGIDRHAWAVEEARWTYRTLGLHGSARQGDVNRLPRFNPGSAAIAAYVLNELSDAMRERVVAALFAAAGRGVSVLILEPIARGIAPWWDETTERALNVGGRADQWRFTIDLPTILRKLDRAAGLDHRELTVRSMWLPGRAASAALR